MEYTRQHSLYHSLLRIGVATLTCTLLFVSGTIHPVTQQLTEDTERYLATTISASAGVAPTELNQITAALTEQSIALEEREASLRERELAVGLVGQTQAEPWLSAEAATWLNSALLFVLIALLLLNYVLDFRQRKISASVASAQASAN